MLSDFSLEEVEHESKVFNNIVNVYNQDLLPKAHQDFLVKLKNELFFEPKVCYDIGACVMHWDRHCRFQWPDAKVYLFEAFDAVEFLYKDRDYHMAVLSDKDDEEVKFYQNDMLFGGNSVKRELTEYFPPDKFIMKKTRTLDSIIKERGWPYGELWKVDIQGNELPMFHGATEALSHAKCILVEMQHIQYNEGAALYDETTKYLNSQGFFCIAEKFSDNGIDADYCFVSKNILPDLMAKLNQQSQPPQ
jgi:FkbM family methyltransferase